MKQGGLNPRMASMIGKAGEYAVAAQLMVRGLNVFFPAVDNGVDLIADNGCRIQVKTGRIRMSPSMVEHYPEGVYSFHFPKNKYIASSKVKIRTVPSRKFSDVCDVVVLWGVEQNRFWIAPASLCDQRQCIIMGPPCERAFLKDVEEMKAMREMGFSQEQIGKEFGISQSSAGKRLSQANIPYYEDNPTHVIRRCENAWENILNFGQPAAVQERVESEASNAE